MMRALTLATLALTAATAACGDDPTYPPTMRDIAGTYTATRFETTTDGSTVDQLAAGATITLTLNLNGTTAGRLFVPGGNPDGSDYDVDLAGAWSVAAWEVDLSHAADTFLRGMTLVWDDGTLDGSQTFGNTLVEVVLRR
jgi:hypothetical protein